MTTYQLPRLRLGRLSDAMVCMYTLARIFRTGIPDVDLPQTRLDGNADHKYVRIRSLAKPGCLVRQKFQRDRELSILKHLSRERRTRRRTLSRDVRRENRGFNLISQIEPRIPDRVERFASSKILKLDASSQRYGDRVSFCLGSSSQCPPESARLALSPTEIDSVRIAESSNIIKLPSRHVVNSTLSQRSRKRSLSWRRLFASLFRNHYLFSAELQCSRAPRTTLVGASK